MTLDAEILNMRNCLNVLLKTDGNRVNAVIGKGIPKQKIRCFMNALLFEIIFQLIRNVVHRQ